MFEYIEGQVDDLTPSYTVLANQGIGYFIHISMNTFGLLKKGSIQRLYIHHVVREDAELLYGFFDRYERDVFRMLITVSGVGANTGRMMLSSLSPDGIQKAILEGNVTALKGIKGIGAKTAQRIIVDLKDKIGKSQISDEFLAVQDNTAREEALSALVNLGFTKSAVEKALDKIVSANPQAGVEELVKQALKNL